MTARDYGQYCGLARALDVVGDRWALLVVRDLLSGPRRFGELQAGLPRIPSNVLTNRLKDLESAGVVERVLVPSPGRGTAYALTEDGRALEPALVALGRWGAPRLGDPREGEIVTPESFAMALRTTFDPGAGLGRRRRPAEIEVSMGDLVVTATVTPGTGTAPGTVDVRTGSAESPDLRVRTDPRIKEVMAGEVSPAQAVATGIAEVEGDTALWERFPALFAV